MAPILNVFAVPMLATIDEMAGGVAVVIDVLRASTTIIHALAAGAREVLPCQEVDEAQTLKTQRNGQPTLLGGERAGLLIPGFDLGNSPDEYTAQRVAGRAILFTTTNGTRAMARCRRADRVLIGAFVNAAAVVAELAEQERIHLVCAGTDGRMSDDDVLAAGLIVHRLQQRGHLPHRLNAQAQVAAETWKAAFPLPQSLGAEPLPPERLAEKLADSLGGKNLIEIGHEHDILTAAQLDRFDIVPELDPVSGRIRVG